MALKLFWGGCSVNSKTPSVIKGQHPYYMMSTVVWAGSGPASPAADTAFASFFCRVHRGRPVPIRRGRIGTSGLQRPRLGALGLVSSGLPTSRPRTLGLGCTIVRCLGETQSRYPLAGLPVQHVLRCYSLSRRLKRGR